MKSELFSRKSGFYHIWRQFQFCHWNLEKIRREEQLMHFLMVGKGEFGNDYFQVFSWRKVKNCSPLKKNATICRRWRQFDNSTICHRRQKIVFVKLKCTGKRVPYTFLERNQFKSCRVHAKTVVIALSALLHIKIRCDLLVEIRDNKQCSLFFCFSLFLLLLIVYNCISVHCNVCCVPWFKYFFLHSIQFQVFYALD